MQDMGTKGGESCTFLPMPLVGDGAGETGTKSILFGDDDDAESLSLCKKGEWATVMWAGH